MNLLIIDNYDSFTHNLQHYFESLGAEVTVVRNDKIQPEDFLNIDRLVLSPGPGLPSETVNLHSIIDQHLGVIPILGVCLGLQALAEYYGAELYNLSTVKHGLQRSIVHNQNGLFNKISSPTFVGLYHSWAVKKDSLPTKVEVTAESEEKVVMAIENVADKMCAVQFHPESILCTEGKQMLKNWMETSYGI